MAENDLSILVGGSILWGPELSSLSNAAVVVENGRIAAIGPSEGLTAAYGSDPTNLVDVSGLTLMPGFMDCHVHIGFYPPKEVLEGGVTTARDLGWPPEIIFPLAEESRAADFAGPRIVSVGPMLTAAGGYPTRAAWAPPGTGLEIADPESAADVVRSLASQGVVAIKTALNPPVGPVLGDDELAAIVRTAHECGLKVTAHIHGIEQLHRALKAGIDELAHALLSDEVIDDATTSRMVDAGVTLVPTLSIFSGRALERAMQNVRAFHDAGGRILYGTDLGNEGPRPGIDTAEIDAMYQAGMSCREILVSGTSDAAVHLGVSETKGLLTEGNDADIVGVHGDPLSDPAAIARVAFVMREGRLVRGP